MLCTWLIIGGGLAEIAGFALVAYELLKAQRRELGDPWPIKQLNAVGVWVRSRLRKLFGRNQTHEASAAGTASSELSATAKGQVRRGRGKTLEDHVAALERNLAELDKEVAAHRAELGRAIEELRGELRGAQLELERQHQKRENKEKEILRDSVNLQWLGIGLFVSGVIASAAANLISC